MLCILEIGTTSKTMAPGCETMAPGYETMARGCETMARERSGQWHQGQTREDNNATRLMTSHQSV